MNLRISLPLQILIAICIGTTLGILLGPICSIFEPIGTAFVMFIQMVVLLYIPSSIIHALGSTSPAVARHLFRKGWVFLLFIWVLIFLSIFLMNNLFPKMEIVFDASKMHSKFEESFLSYLVPKNPIYDLANNIIPAIAIFAIIMGVALMHLTHKKPLISFLERINNTIEKVLKRITLISPFGVAAIFANVVGNVFIEDLLDFGFFIFPLIILVCIFTFWALPALLQACTPLKYREIINEFRSTCLIAFVIGSPSIAISFLNQCVKKLADKFDIKDKELHNTTQMIVPLTYTFTQVGNLLILFFIMFLSYYFGMRLDWLDQAEAFCKRNPQYIVMDYENHIGEAFLAFPVKFNAFAFIFYLNSWIDLSRNRGFDKQMYEYWMLGHPPVEKKVRWSILKGIVRSVE